MYQQKNTAASLKKCLFFTYIMITFLIYKLRPFITLFFIKEWVLLKMAVLAATDRGRKLLNSIQSKYKIQ